MTFIQHDIFEVERETGSVLCRIALWEYFGAQPRPQRFSLRKSTRAFSVQVIFPIRLVKMKMERVVRPEIFWNTRTTFRGIPLFPFQPVGTEVPVPCAQFCVGRRLAPRNFPPFSMFVGERCSRAVGVFLFISYLRQSSFFSPFSVVRPTQIFGIFQKKKVST